MNIARTEKGGRGELGSKSGKPLFQAKTEVNAPHPSYPPDQENIKCHKSQLATMAAAERLMVNGKECDLESFHTKNRKLHSLDSSCSVEVIKLSEQERKQCH